MTGLRKLASRLIGLKFAMNATDSATVDDSSVDLDTQTFSLLVTTHATDGTKTWQLLLRLDHNDTEILGEGDEAALEAYGQVIIANIGEWWNTGLRTVIISAQLQS